MDFEFKDEGDFVFLIPMSDRARAWFVAEEIPGSDGGRLAVMPSFIDDFKEIVERHGFTHQDG